jgi:hypothetical protein
MGILCRKQTPRPRADDQNVPKYIRHKIKQLGNDSLNEFRFCCLRRVCASVFSNTIGVDQFPTRPNNQKCEDGTLLDGLLIIMRPSHDILL